MAGRTIDDLRHLADAGVLDTELVERAERDFRGLALCWCVFDMPEHDVDAIEVGDGASALVQDHVFAASGTRYVAWMLGAAEGVPFLHDHGEDPRQGEKSVRSSCVLCRVEAWERGQGTLGSTR